MRRVVDRRPGNGALVSPRLNTQCFQAQTALKCEQTVLKKKGKGKENNSLKGDIHVPSCPRRLIESAKTLALVQEMRDYAVAY